MGYGHRVLLDGLGLVPLGLVPSGLYAAAEAIKAASPRKPPTAPLPGPQPFNRFFTLMVN